MPELAAKFYHWVSSMATGNPVIYFVAVTAGLVMIMLFLKGAIGRMFPG